MIGKKKFGELVVTIGKKHTFLGVNINIREDKKVEIGRKSNFWNQYMYLEKILMKK